MLKFIYLFILRNKKEKNASLKFYEAATYKTQNQLTFPPH